MFGKNFAWTNENGGQVVPLDTIHISPTIKGLNYGLSTFEGIRAYEASVQNPPEYPPTNSAIFRLPEHVERWLYSMSVLQLQPGCSQEQLEKAIVDVVRANDMKECYIRPIAWDATEKIGIHGKPEKVGMAIFVSEFGKYIPKDGLDVGISSYIRPHPKTVAPKAKLSACYMNSFLATTEAHNLGFDEALQLDYRGYASEMPGANVAMVKGRRIITPPLEASILPGLTRKTIKQVNPELNLTFEEMDILPGQLYESDEVLTFGTAMEVNGIVSISNGDEKHVIGDGKVGPITKKVLTKYKEIVTGKDVNHRDWLTYVYSKS